VDGFSYLSGPTFSLWNGNFAEYVMLITAGGARVPDPVPNGGVALVQASVHYPALELGWQRRYRRFPCVRVSVSIDCLHAISSTLFRRHTGENVIPLLHIVYYIGNPADPDIAQQNLI